MYKKEFMKTRLLISLTFAAMTAAAAHVAVLNLVKGGEQQANKDIEVMLSKSCVSDSCQSRKETFADMKKNGRWATISEHPFIQGGILDMMGDAPVDYMRQKVALLDEIGMTKEAELLNDAGIKAVSNAKNGLPFTPFAGILSFVLFFAVSGKKKEE